MIHSYLSVSLTHSLPSEVRLISRLRHYSDGNSIAFYYYNCRWYCTMKRAVVADEEARLGQVEQMDQLNEFI